MFVLFGCLHLIGGPYCLIQVYAWSAMLADYSREDGIVQGVKDTFSGEKPCALCCKIKSAKPTGSGNQNPVQFPSSPKLLQEMVPMGEVVILPPPAASLPPVAFTDAALSVGIRPGAPPVPPPCRSA